VSDADAPRETMWQGKYVRAIKQGRWEYVSRTNEVRAVVILAEHEDRLILVEQFRFPIGARCLELPAGLVGDEGHIADVEETALRELEEETGFTAERIERLGDYYSSPGMLAEGFSLVRAHGLRKVGEGGNCEVLTVVAPLSGSIKKNSARPRTRRANNVLQFVAHIQHLAQRNSEAIG